MSYAGFLTINFNQEISVNKSQTFRVEVTLKNKDGYDCTDILPLEIWGNNYSKVSSSMNQSFILANVNNVVQWLDLYNYNKANICLHVFSKAVGGLNKTKLICNNLTHIMMKIIWLLL